MNDEQRQIWIALAEVEQHARNMVTANLNRIGQAPIKDWTQAKHDEYFKKASLDAQKVQMWCFVEQMKINPD